MVVIWVPVGSSQTVNKPYWWQSGHVQYASHNLAESDKAQSHLPRCLNLLPWLRPVLRHRQVRHQNVPVTSTDSDDPGYLSHLYRHSAYPVRVEPFHG